MNSVHAIVLTLDEELHIARCIQSIQSQCDSITVVDSGSRDATVAIAKSLGAEVVVNGFVNHSAQINFAIEHLSGRGGWLFRIDADEVLESSDELGLRQSVSFAEVDCDGLLVRRRIYFMGQRIRHGGIEPSWQLRLWRNGRGRCEQRWMDEHLMVSGRIKRSHFVISDKNLRPLDWWTAKHNYYASREAIESLNMRYGLFPVNGAFGGLARQARARRWLKNNVYSTLPLGVRASAYFWYRYIVRLGFVDGVPGYLFHSLQGRWYRTLVDAKVAEIEMMVRSRGMPIREAIMVCTGIDLSRHV